MHTKTLSAAMITLTACGVAAAGAIRTDVDAGATRQSPGFVQLDADGDGSLGKSEINADPLLRTHWNQLDENQDGVVSHSEFSAFEADSVEERAEGRD